MQLLLSFRARASATTSDQQTALHFAARAGAQGQVLEQLLAEGLAVDARDRWGRTPLHWAVVNGHRSVVQRLLGHGADRLALDAQRETPLQVAERRAQCRASDRGDRGASVFGDIAKLLGGTASTQKGAPRSVPVVVGARNPALKGSDVQRRRRFESVLTILDLISRRSYRLRVETMARRHLFLLLALCLLRRPVTFAATPQGGAQGDASAEGGADRGAGLSPWRLLPIRAGGVCLWRCLGLKK